MTSITVVIATDVPIAVATGLAFVAAAVGVVVSIRAGLTASAANEIAEQANDAAERSLVLSVRPVLVGDPDSVEPFEYAAEEAPTNTKYRSGTSNNPALRVSFPVRNMGAGPALVCSAAVHTAKGDVLVNGSVSGLSISLSKLVVCQGESCQFYFVLLLPEVTDEKRRLRKDMEENGFEVQLEYMDLAEGQRSLTVMKFGIHSGKDLKMSSIALFDCDNNWKPAAQPVASNTQLLASDG